jgi:DNA-binding NarL/FixJ family response regulator
LDRIRVLLADDHKAMLDRVAGLLATECNVVGTVADGQQAFDAVMELKPDVLVLDISMPVMNGIETARRLKEAGSETHIVFLSMYDDPDIVREALEAGAQGYVTKQCITSDLVAAIKKAHAGRQQGRMRPRSSRSHCVATGYGSRRRMFQAMPVCALAGNFP